MDSVMIYAEGLATLRQVSLFVTFPTPADEDTTVRIIDAGEKILVSHDGNTSILKLPAAVTAPPVLPFNMTTLSSTHLSATWKLPMTHAVTVPHYVHEHQDVPWEANDLKVGASVKCRSCSQTLVKEGTVIAWKDLPSENWAEMMEFWYCHKPDVPHDRRDHNHLTHRVYGANGTISAQKGIGFVDLSSFLFVTDDVVGVEFTPAPIPESSVDGNIFAKPIPVPVRCSSCQQRVGSHDMHLASTVLFKWKLSTDSDIAAPSSVMCLSGSLLASMSQSGYSKSILLPTPRLVSSKRDENSDDDNSNKKGKHEAKDLLFLWVMNPNIMYSATNLAEGQPAIRLMFKFVSSSEANELLDSPSSDVKELVWAEDAIRDVVNALKTTYDALPAEARGFQVWKVAILDKWERA